VFALLPNKLTETYRIFFNAILTAIENRGLMLNLERVTIDFEAAVREAVVTTFPQVAVNGCHFHFCQAIYRKVQSLGLQQEYRGNTYGLRDFTRQLGGLALVPLAVVRPLFQQLRATTPPLAAVPLLVEYFQQQWIDSCPPRLWNCYAIEGAKTNNYLEGFHNKLNSCFQRRHPNIFIFVEEIRRLEKVYNLRIRQAAA
jgi:hypothetical protein